MSVYQVNKLLYLTDNDAAFRERIKTEPEAVLNEFRLTNEERDALTSGAVGKLYQMGVHTFLLNHMYRWELFGVSRYIYLARIRLGMPLDPRFELGNLPVQRFVNTLNMTGSNEEFRSSRSIYSKHSVGAGQIPACTDQPSALMYLPISFNVSGV